jgi:hypothetical protein
MPGRPCPDTQSDGTAVSNTQKFIWGALNTLNEDCLGSMVIAELAASQTTRVDIEVGILADERAAAQSESVNNTTSSKITISDKASKSSNLTVALAHELFHSYQTHFGDVTASIFSEVEANIFTSKIFKVCYMYNFEKGNDCQQEDNFNTNVMSLVYNSYTYEILNNVVSNFKYFSSANSKGLYDNFPLYNRSNQKSLLMELLNK